MRSSMLHQVAAMVFCGVTALGLKCDPTGQSWDLSASALTVGTDVDPDGYLLQLENKADASPVGTPIHIPANGRVDLGEHVVSSSFSAWQVRMSDIAPNCLPALNPVTVQDGHAPFEVTCGANVGSVKLDVATTGTAYTGQYLVKVDWSTEVPTGTTAVQTLTGVPVGQHSATLDGLPPFCATPQPTIVADVAFGEETEFSWDVTCDSQRALDVVVQTTGGQPDPDGYAVTASFDVNGATVEFTEATQANETVHFVSLVPVMHQLRLTGLASNCTTPSNPRTVTPPATGVGIETFTVDCPQVSHLLTVDVQAAPGTGVDILANGVAMACGISQCTASFADNTAVTLTLDPAPGSVVTAIAGDCTAEPGLATATVVMDEAKDCSVTVGQAPPVLHPLTIAIQAIGGAGVTILANNVPMVCTALNCIGTFLEGTMVGLTLNAIAGSVITGITGDCAAGPGLASATVLMNGPKLCTVVVQVVAVASLVHRSTRLFNWNGESMLKRPLTGSSLQAARSRLASGRRAATATLLVAARVPDPGNGSAPVIEYNLDDPTNPVDVSDGGLCGVRTMVYAVDPAIGPSVYGFSGDSPWSCLTPYPFGMVLLFNFGSSAGEAITLPNDPSHIIVGQYFGGHLRRMQLGGNTTFHQLVSGQQTCPGDLALHGNTLLIAGREGTVGTTTENCNNHRGVFKFDLATNTVTGFTALNGMIRDVVLNADGSRAYVADYSGNAVHVVDVATMTLVRSIPMSGGPTVVALTPGDSHLLVGLWDANELRMLDLANDQVVDTESSRGVSPAGLVVIDQMALLMNFGIPGPGGTGSSLAVFEFTTPAASASAGQVTPGTRTPRARPSGSRNAGRSRQGP